MLKILMYYQTKCRVSITCLLLCFTITGSCTIVDTTVALQACQYENKVKFMHLILLYNIILTFFIIYKNLAVEINSVSDNVSQKAFSYKLL